VNNTPVAQTRIPELLSVGRAFNLDEIISYSTLRRKLMMRSLFGD
jgi:hypothetical protein